MQITDIEGAFKLKRKEVWNRFLESWFLFASILSSDTYKRTMGAVGGKFASEFSAYHLTLRKPLKEEGVNNQFIMAGHEWLLRQWFLKPLKRRDIALMIEWYTKCSKVKAFPVTEWTELLEDQQGDDIYLPIDVYGFPGGQTFLTGVPCMSFEGIGAFTTMIEPHMCHYFAPIIHAVKGRLMYEASRGIWAEFGYRADQSDINTCATLLAIYIGAGDVSVRTSVDAMEFLFPELFRSMGTMGHEGGSSEQSFRQALERTEEAYMEKFVSHHGSAALLYDLVDRDSGFEAALRVMKSHLSNRDIGIRVDSSPTGDLADECINRHLQMKTAGVSGIPNEGEYAFDGESYFRHIVYEDGVTPQVVRHVNKEFFLRTGDNPNEILVPGSGGYFRDGVHRDAASAAMKRSMTGRQPNRKIGAEGRDSAPGRVRVYVDSFGETLIVADASEDNIQGEPLFVPLVQQGRIVYAEDGDFRRQAKRANDTWGRYKRAIDSPLVAKWKARFLKMQAETRARTAAEK